MTVFADTRQNHTYPQASPAILRLIEENKRLCQQLAQLGRPCGESTLDVVSTELYSFLDDFPRPRSGAGASSAESFGSAKGAKAKRSRGSRGALLQAVGSPSGSRGALVLAGDSPSGSRGSKTAICGESPKASAAAVRSKTNLAAAAGVPGPVADRRSKTNVAAGAAGHKPRGGTRVVRLGSLIPEVPTENAPGPPEPANAVAAAADREAGGNAFR